MEYIINEELIPLINGGKLNAFKIECLIEIRDFVNRVSTHNYLDDETVARIYRKHNAYPTVITWGDYFQTELAFDIVNLSDGDFDKAVSTIKYDVISSFIIFSEKDISFFDWVESNYQYLTSIKDKLSEKEYEEAEHLKILKDYYVSLGIVDEFSEEELDWYNSYKEAVAV